MLTNMVRAYRMVARAEAVEKTRQRLLEAATALFAQRPYDLVSLADMARQSGVGLATLVRQFETKERLFAAAIASGRDDMTSLFAATPENDPVAAVQTMVEGYERYGDAIARLLALEERLPDARAAVAHGRSAHREWVQRVFGATLRRRRGRARKLHFAQLMAATDLQFWKLFRRDLKLGRADTEAALLEVIKALCR
jgi:AcrR family transcriptional regulator